MTIVRRTFGISFIVMSVAFFLAFAFTVFASLDDVTYPIPELANCSNKEECFAYCDERENILRVKLCIDFAQKHNLLSPEELQEAEYYVTTLGVTSGPGGCRNRLACEAYCEDTAHLDECLDFAEKHSIRGSEEIAEGRKVAQALREGASLPGGCRTKIACEEYCNNPSNMRQCVDFAKKAGFMSQKEIEEAGKIIPLLERGEKTPGNCGRKESCEAYCHEPEHIEECLLFAEKAGILSKEELADAKKVAPFIKSGETPGGCRRREECDAYCSQPGHFEECVAFAERAGLMNKEDVDLARKVKGMGPGGCASKEACMSYCRDPLHQEECMNFAREHGLMDEFPAEKMRAEANAEAQGEVKRCLELTSCEEVIGCFKSIGDQTQQGPEGLPPEAHEKLEQCIAEMQSVWQERARVEGEQGGSFDPNALPPPPLPPPLPNTLPVPPADTTIEYQQQYQEQYKSQYEQEYQRQYEEASTQYCHLFEAAPTCELAAPVGSENYNLCKKCFPDK